MTDTHSSDVAVLLGTVDAGVQQSAQVTDDRTCATILKDIGSWISHSSPQKTGSESLPQFRMQPPDYVAEELTTKCGKKETESQLHSAFVVPCAPTDHISRGEDSWLRTEDNEACIIDDITSRVMQCIDHCAALDRLGDIGPDSPTAWYFSLDSTAMGGSERCVCALSGLL